MTFKPTIFLLFSLLWISLAGFATEQEDKNSSRFFALSRPFLMRSDIISSGTFNKLRGTNTTPGYSQLPGYSLQGYPQFQHIYATYNLGFGETHLARSPRYARILNKKFKSYILQHPEKFSAETIADYSQGFTNRNPKTIEGISLEWHHDGKHRFLLVEQGEHHSLPHVGGNKIWGSKYAKNISRVPNLETVWTARRWAKFSALELAWSSVALMTSHDKDYRTYTVNALASISSGFLAWGIESLTIKSFPLTIGTTPYFINMLPVNIGGPASWIATGIFMLTKTAIMTGWKEYQLMEALEIEKSCQYAEHFALVSKLKTAGKNNSEVLLQIIAGH